MGAQQRQAALCRLHGLGVPAGRQSRLAQVDELQHVERDDVHGRRLLGHPFQQRQAFIDAPAADVGEPEARRGVLVKRAEIAAPADVRRAFEQGDRLFDLAAHQVALTGTRIGGGETVGVVGSLGDAQALLCHLGGGREIPQASQAPAHPGARGDRLQRRHAEALGLGFTGAPFQVARETVDGLVEVSVTDVGLANPVVRQRVQGAVCQRVRHGQRALAVGERAVGVADTPAPGRHGGRNPALATLVAEPVGQLFGFAQDLDDAGKFSQRYQRTVQIEAQVDRLGHGGFAFTQVAERRQRLFHTLHRLAGGASFGRPQAGLVQVGDGLGPQLAAQRVVGELVHVVGRMPGIGPLERLHDATVQRTPGFVQQRVVRHFLCQRVLEGVFQFWEQAGLVQELRRLQAFEQAAQRIFILVDDCLEQGKRHFAANHGSRLQQPLLFRREPVDARGKHCLHGRRHLDLGRLQVLQQAVRTRLARDDGRLDQRPHPFLEEERIAAGALHQHRNHRLQRGLVTQQRRQQRVGPVPGQRLDANAGAVTLVAPLGLVLGPVGRQHEHRQTRNVVDQAIQQRLAFGVEGMQVLEHHQQRLCLRLAQQQLLERVEGEFSALGRIGLEPCRVGDRHIEQREQREQRRRQRLVERRQCRGDLAEDLRVVVAFIEPEVSPQQLNDGQERSRAAIRDRTGLEHQPVAQGTGANEFVQQTRLAHTRLAHDRNHLALPAASQRQRAMQLGDRLLPSGESREPARDRGLQARADLARPGDFIHFDRRTHSLDRPGAEECCLHEPLGRPQPVGRDQDRARQGHLFHPRRQVRRLAHRGVVHAQVTADRPHHDLARVQAHAHAHVDAVAALDGPGALHHRLLDAQRGITRPHGMVLVRQWRTEQRHDAVTHDLVDGAFVAMHRFHHELEHRVQNGARFFRIAIVQHLHRSLDVGEQHADLLALANHRLARAEDLRGQVLGGVVLRGSSLGVVARQGSGSRERGAASLAAFVTRRVGRAARAAGVGEAGAALRAELRDGRHVRAATETLHVDGPSHHACGRAGGRGAIVHAGRRDGYRFPPRRC